MNFAGNYKNRIGIYAVTKTKNDYSERKRTYSLSFSVRAIISFASATEKMTSQAQHPEKTLKFQVRFHPSNYSETQVIKHDNDYYNITGIDHDRNRKFTILNATRLPAGAITLA